MEDTSQPLPEPWKVELHQGLACLHAGDHEAATAHFLRAHDLAPECAEVCVALGQQRLHAGAVHEAEALLRQAWAADPALVPAAAALARCLALAQERVAEGLSVLRRARELCAGAPAAGVPERGAPAPGELPAHQHERRTDDTGAAASANRTRESHSGLLTLLTVESEIWLKLGRREEAQRAAELALAHEPPAASDALRQPARTALARCHNLEGVELAARSEHERAIFCFKRARDLAPDWTQPVIHMAAAFASIGRAQPARAAYERAVAMEPQSAQAQLSLGLFLAEHGEPEDALLVLQRAVALAPESLRARAALAELFVEHGATEEAIDLWRHAVERDPDRAEPWVGLGSTYAATGNHSRAEACLRRALELDPDNVAACCSLADLLTRESRFREAAVFARRASDLDPERAESLLGHGSNPSRRP